MVTGTCLSVAMAPPLLRLSMKKQARCLFCLFWENFSKRYLKYRIVLLIHDWLTGSESCRSIEAYFLLMLLVTSSYNHQNGLTCSEVQHIETGDFFLPSLVNNSIPDMFEAVTIETIRYYRHNVNNYDEKLVVCKTRRRSPTLTQSFVEIMILQIKLH